MTPKLHLFILLLTLTVLGSNACKPLAEKDEPKNAVITLCTINGVGVGNGRSIGNVECTEVNILLSFSSPIKLSELNKDLLFFSGTTGDYTATLQDECTLKITPNFKMDSFSAYTLIVLKGVNLGVNLPYEYSYKFTTVYNTTPKFPEISDEELMNLLQKRTFNYFWDYAHPVSGLARERLGSGETVTTGGSGFGLMALLVGIERGFITRAQGSERVNLIVDFLTNKADTFHGVFPHWLNGSTGATLPFSTYDNGADLVETSFLMQGLLACRQYFDDSSEASLRSKITSLWEAVEWDWFTREGTMLYWHWSPNYEWKMNLGIRGWNEALIVYVLAASSPKHSIQKEVYDKGWADKGGIKNGRHYYGITLPLGSDYGGPLFFAHYSFLGLDPRGLTDAYASYFEQNVAHAKIHHAYCSDNPKNHAGYSSNCWGLTASDYSKGYTASSPTNDTGTIAPTAALSSMPYTPEESIAAMKHFYYVLGDRLFGEYGFYDAFSLQDHWFAKSYLAIDQGPIVVMIENYRTGLLWDVFMKDPDVRAGLSKLGFILL